MINLEEKMVFQLISKETGERSSCLCFTWNQAAHIARESFTADFNPDDHYLLVIQEESNGVWHYSDRPLMTLALFVSTVDALVKDASMNEGSDNV